MADKVSIRIPSEIKNIKKVSSGILKDLKPRKIGDDAAFDIRLCVDEAVRNAIMHGNKSKKGLSVTVTYSIRPDSLEVEVADEGKGFDHRDLPDPTTGENIMRNSGRGILIMRKLMDRVEFRGPGNVVRMIKYFKKKGEEDGG